MKKFSVLVANLKTSEQYVQSYREGTDALKKLIKKKEAELVAMKKNRKQLSQAGLTTKYLDRCYTEAVADLKNTVIRYLNIRDRRDESIKLVYEIKLLFKKAGIECDTQS